MDDIERWRGEIEGMVGKLTSEWEEELIERCHALDLKLRSGETGRREAKLMRKAGIILKALREGQSISPDSLGRALNKDRGLVAFLENGFLELKEITPELKQGLSVGLDIRPEIVDLLFEVEESK